MFKKLMLLGAAVWGCSFGATIFSNLVQPGNQYGPDSVGIGHTPSFSQAGDFLVYAVKFTPGAAYRLTSFSAPFGIASGPNQIQAYLYSDAGGRPGSVLEAYTASQLPGPGPIPLTTLSSSLDPVLVPGHPYWIGATGGGTTFAQWTLTLFQGDPGDGGAEQLVTGGVAGAWIVGSGTRTGALVVTGDPVPEPESIRLVAFGCVVLCCAWNRRGMGRSGFGRGRRGKCR